MSDVTRLIEAAQKGDRQAAAALGISRATASRYWTYARAWLINALDE